uniref:DUF4371 domain-containing protein n=1 Tax=Kalanchoe fedtschenkoi TaxID=63787 RepID=A0A7N0UPF6_KALFE
MHGRTTIDSSRSQSHISAIARGSEYNSLRRTSKQSFYSKWSNGALDKFVVKELQISLENESIYVNLFENYDNVKNIVSNDNIDHSDTDDNDNIDLIHSFGSKDCFKNLNDDGQNEESLNSRIDIFDPRYWDTLDSKMINILAVKGSKRDMFIQKGPKNKIEHEVGMEHKKNWATWYELRCRLNANKTIDHAAQKQFTKERDHWKNVLVRIISIVKFLAKHSIAFRGTKERLYENNNRNFLGLIEILVEFDQVIQEHVRRITSDDIHFHYLGHNIQNELISLIASSIKSEIIKKERQPEWQILKDNVKELTLIKSLSSTRWESRVDSVKATIRFRIGERSQVSENDNDPKIKSEAKSLS